MVLTAGMIGLAAQPQAPCGCSMGAVLSWSWLMLKLINNQKPPRLSHGTLVGLEGLPTSGVHGLSLESFLRQP